MNPATGRASTIERLKIRIAQIERCKRIARNGGSRPRLWPGVAAETGVLHEARAADYRDAPAAAAFALALAFALAGREGLLLIVEPARQAAIHGAIWGRGLAAFGIDPERVVFVRPRSQREALWAAEEAAHDKAAAAVLLLVRDRNLRLTLTAGRRLHLAGIASGATPILVRTLHKDLADAPSAAAMRWRIEPARSSPSFWNPKAPGAPRWRVALEKGFGAPSEDHLVEWRHDEARFVRIGEKKTAHSRFLLPASVRGSLPAAMRSQGWTARAS